MLPHILQTNKKTQKQVLSSPLEDESAGELCLRIEMVKIFSGRTFQISARLSFFISNSFFLFSKFGSSCLLRKTLKALEDYVSQ